MKIIVLSIINLTVLVLFRYISEVLSLFPPCNAIIPELYLVWILVRIQPMLSVNNSSNKQPLATDLYPDTFKNGLVCLPYLDPCWSCDQLSLIRGRRILNINSLVELLLLDSMSRTLLLLWGRCSYKVIFSLTSLFLHRIQRCDIHSNRLVETIRMNGHTVWIGLGIVKF